MVIWDDLKGLMQNLRMEINIKIKMIEHFQSCGNDGEGHHHYQHL